MKKIFTIALVAAVAFVGTLFAPKSAEAVPSFARQVGVGCHSCHFQTVPRLNAFGRSFKLGGMTQASSALIEDDGISLPAVANLSAIVKARFIQGKPHEEHKLALDDAAYFEERGVVEMPDEAVLWLGGRIGENWGFATENLSSVIKVVHSRNLGGIQAGFSLAATDAHGSATGLELYNTGAVKNHRMFENSAATLASVNLTHYSAPAVGLSQSGGAVGMGYGEATAATFFAGNDLFFASFALHAPGASSKAGGSLDVTDPGFGGFANMVRAAITPKLGEGMDLMVGVQMSMGTAEFSNHDYEEVAGLTPQEQAATQLTKIKAEATVVDFQLQMADIGHMSLEVNGAYVTIPKSEFSAPDAMGTALGLPFAYSDYKDGKINWYNGTSKDVSGWDVNVGLGVTHSLGVKLAMMGTDNGQDTGNKLSANTLGLWYDIKQNVVFHFEYSMWDGDHREFDNQMFLMLELGI